MNINKSLKLTELKLTPSQLHWVVNLPWRDPEAWIEEGAVLYLENEDLKVQVAKEGGLFRIITWED